MFFSDFKIANQMTNAQKDITTVTSTFNQINDWWAYRFFVTEPTTINGFAVRLSATPTGSNTLTVGITTSLGPNGVFPYVISNEFMNSNVGTAKTIGGFVYTQTKTFTTSDTAGLISISDLSEFTLQPYVAYWVGCHLSAVTSAGAFILNDISLSGAFSCAYNSPDNSLSFLRLNSSVGTTIANDRIFAVPFYSSAGQTKYYTKYPALPDDQARSVTVNMGNPREFGYKFEFNNFPIQDFEVRSITFGHMRVSSPDSEYCMRIYDGTNFDNLVGTGNTLKGYDISAFGSTYGNHAEWEFIFEPPLKLRTNKTYYAGIAWTYPTVAPVAASFIVRAPVNLFGVSSDQSCSLAWRASVGTGALTDAPAAFNIKYPLNMFITKTKTANRAVGN